MVNVKTMDVLPVPKEKNVKNCLNCKHFFKISHTLSGTHRCDINQSLILNPAMALGCRYFKTKIQS